MRTEKVSSGANTAAAGQAPATSPANRTDELIAKHNAAGNDVKSGWVWNRTTTPKLGNAESEALLKDVGSLPAGQQKDVVRELERRINGGELQMSAYGLVRLLQKTKSLGMKSALRRQEF